MKNKMMLLALGLLALVFAAMPAVASAGTPEIDSKLLNEGKSLSFTSSGNFSELRAANEPEIKCASNHGTGKYTSKTTGEFALTFTGCFTEFFGFRIACSSGTTTEVISIANSVFHNVYLTDGKTTPGILVTPPTGGVFATIKCGSLTPIEVKGNGVIGDLSAPKCGGSSTTATLAFTATGSVQTYKQNTATGTVFNLTSTTEGGSAVEAAEEAIGTVTYPENITVTCV